MAAAASLRDQGELERRAKSNAVARREVLGALAERSLPHTPSQANFVYFELGMAGGQAADLFTQRGVIVRPMGGGWLRVTIGAEHENKRFLDALDEVVAESEPSAPSQELGR